VLVINKKVFIVNKKSARHKTKKCLSRKNNLLIINKKSARD
jgi:ribosomal protein L36